MRFVRRLAGLLCGGAGAIGLVLGVAGLVGVWVGHGEVVRRVDRVFDGADRGLAGVQENLRQATDRLRDTETELEAVRKREADLATRPPSERPGHRAASRKVVEGLGPGVAEARATLVKATESALVANGWLEIVPDDDGRSQPFRLTAEGRRLMERALPAWEQAQVEAKKLLGDDGLRLLDAAIGRVKSAPAGA